MNRVIFVIHTVRVCFPLPSSPPVLIADDVDGACNRYYEYHLKIYICKTERKIKLYFVINFLIALLSYWPIGRFIKRNGLKLS